MNLEFLDDKKIEWRLGRMGLSWTRADVRYTEIDIKASHANNARLDKALDPDVTLQYAIAMLGGAKFPSPVFGKINGKYRTHSGNHRVGAVGVLIEQGDIVPQDAIFRSAYVVATGDQMLIELLTRTANRDEGKGQGKTEAFEHCRWMMTKYNMTIPQLAKEFSLKEDWLKDRLATEELRRQLEESQVPTNHLSHSSLLKLKPLTSNGKVLKYAAFVAERYKLSGDRLGEFVSKVKSESTKSEADGMAAVKSQENSLRVEQSPNGQTATVIRRPTRARFFTFLNGFHNFLKCGNRGGEFSKLSEIQISDKHDRHDAHAVWKSLKKKLDTLFHDAQAADA